MESQIGTRVAEFLLSVDAALDMQMDFMRHGRLRVIPCRDREYRDFSCACEAEIDTLAADRHGSGWASAAMGILCDIADIHRVRLLLVLEGPCRMHRLAALHSFAEAGRDSFGTRFLLRQPEALSADIFRRADLVWAGETVPWTGHPDPLHRQPGSWPVRSNLLSMSSFIRAQADAVTMSASSPR